MYVVVMDNEGGKHADKPLEDKKYIKQLREAMNTLRGAGYVHGDLREPNVLITMGGLRIVNFDWRGENGVT